jgi:hypothetical protein
MSGVKWITEIPETVGITQPSLHEQLKNIQPEWGTQNTFQKTMSATLSLRTIPRGMRIEIEQTHTASYADMDCPEATTFKLLIPYIYGS